MGSSFTGVDNANGPDVKNLLEWELPKKYFSLKNYKGRDDNISVTRTKAHGCLLWYFLFWTRYSHVAARSDRTLYAKLSTRPVHKKSTRYQPHAPLPGFAPFLRPSCSALSAAPFTLFAFKRFRLFSPLQTMSSDHSSVCRRRQGKKKRMLNVLLISYPTGQDAW
jgi:hypothetical protein